MWGQNHHVVSPWPGVLPWAAQSVLLECPLGHSNAVLESPQSPVKSSGRPGPAAPQGPGLAPSGLTAPCSASRNMPGFCQCAAKPLNVLSPGLPAAPFPWRTSEAGIHVCWVLSPRSPLHWTPSVFCPSAQR